MSSHKRYFQYSGRTKYIYFCPPESKRKPHIFFPQVITLFFVLSISFSSHFVKWFAKLDKQILFYSSHIFIPPPTLGTLTRLENKGPTGILSKLRRLILTN